MDVFIDHWKLMFRELGTLNQNILIELQNIIILRLEYFGVRQNIWIDRSRIVSFS